MAISIDTHKHAFMYNTIMYNIIMYNIIMYCKWKLQAHNSFILHSWGKWQAFQSENLKTKNRIQNSFNHLHSCHHLFNFIKSILYSAFHHNTRKPNRKIIHSNHNQCDERDPNWRPDYCDDIHFNLTNSMSRIQTGFNEIVTWLAHHHSQLTMKIHNENSQWKFTMKIHNEN